MSWDFALNEFHDMSGGIVTGRDEIMQRLKVRLWRELGEWFMNTSVGLPWYQGGYGILGTSYKNKKAVDLLIRREILNTVGVLRILEMSTFFVSATREYNIRVVILIEPDITTVFTLQVLELVKKDCIVPCIPASMICFVTEYGNLTLQQMYDMGLLKGPQGEPGISGSNGTNGRSATITVGSVQVTEDITKTSVKNSGTKLDAVFDFVIPRGTPGKDSEIRIGSVDVGEDGHAEVHNSGTPQNVILDFVVPRGPRGIRGLTAVDSDTIDFTITEPPNDAEALVITAKTKGMMRALKIQDSETIDLELTSDNKTDGATYTLTAKTKGGLIK